ncbi:MAG TPA: SMP-30/gluconolactonase/LRE family protein [Steroidobacteraceae bacterium]|jgi:sugar lactone lactonase YvrE
MSASAPIDVIPAANGCGEGVLWDGRRQALWWTDIPGRRLHRYDWSTRSQRSFETPERVGSFGLVAGSDQFITAFESGIALYDPASTAGEQRVSWLARPQAGIRGIRFNDGRVDRRGRFWCGTMVEEAGITERGNLYSIDGSQQLQCHVRGVSISNGLCMSRDGTQLYFADSAARTIHVYELIEPEGLLSTPRLFAQTPEGALPDGAAIDAEGHLWSAQWGAACIARYTPDGRLERTVPVPASQPTCVCFGGPDLDLLFVTSARDGLDAAKLAHEPHAGHVFVYHTGVRGLPEEEYRL